MYFKIILPVAFTSHFKKKKILKSDSAKRTSVDFIVSGELCQVQASGACFSRCRPAVKAVQQDSLPACSLFLQLEGRVEELLKELKESRDKVIHQEQAAKTALQQMQKEMTYRLEQVELDLVN